MGKCAQIDHKNGSLIIKPCDGNLWQNFAMNVRTPETFHLFTKKGGKGINGEVNTQGKVSLVSGPGMTWFYDKRKHRIGLGRATNTVFDLDKGANRLQMYYDKPREKQQQFDLKTKRGGTFKIMFRGGKKCAQANLRKNTIEMKACSSSPLQLFVKSKKDVGVDDSSSSGCDEVDAMKHQIKKLVKKNDKKLESLESELSSMESKESSKHSCSSESGYSSSDSRDRRRRRRRRRPRRSDSSNSYSCFDQMRNGHANPFQRRKRFRAFDSCSSDFDLSRLC